MNRPEVGQSTPLEGRGRTRLLLLSLLLCGDREGQDLHGYREMLRENSSKMQGSEEECYNWS